MPYNAMLKDEQTGETLQLWAVLTEEPRFINTISGEPIDTKKSGGQLTSNILNDHIHHEALEFSVTLDLVGGPGGVEGAVGGPGYEVEQYNKLVDFSNRDTTFTYTSYIFVGQSPRGETVAPGLEFPFLAIAEFSPVKGGGKGFNIIGARLKFQSVVVTYGNTPISDPDVAYGNDSERKLNLVHAGTTVIWQASTFAGATIGSLFGPIGTLIGAGIGAIIGLIVGSAASEGSLAVETGSIPRQVFNTEIGGTTFTFELRSNPEYEIVTFSMSYEETDLVREQRVVYGMDLLAGVVHPSVNGLHIVPMDPSDQEDEVTTENLGRTVQLIVFREV